MERFRSTAGFVAAGTVAAIGTFSTAASAHDVDVDVNIYRPRPVYVVPAPRPVYVAPARRVIVVAPGRDCVVRRTRIRIGDHYAYRRVRRCY